MKNEETNFVWAIKWFSSIVILLAIVVRSLAKPELISVDIVLSLVGAVGWAYVAFVWNDRALLLLNVVISVVLMFGVFNIFI